MDKEKWEEFSEKKIEEKMQENFLQVPFMRANRGCPAIIVEKPNRWGFSLKTVIRQTAKNLPEYHWKIKNDYLPMEVESDGKKFSVDTLGRWAFGMPGYGGHLLFEGGEKNCIKIYMPKNAPPQLSEMLMGAIDKMEGK